MPNLGLKHTPLAFARQPKPSTLGGHMDRGQDQGHCENCLAPFAYRLIHNGFNESSFGYCERCGRTALLGWRDDIPAEANFARHQQMSSETEDLLAPCLCGGRFRGSASPRCPNCKHPLDAGRAAQWIEANATGTARGWRW